MIQPSILRLHRGRAILADKPHTIVRCFSANHSFAQINTPRPSTHENSISTSKSVAESFQAQHPRRSKIPPARLNLKDAGSSRPLPRRVVDARSMAASRSGSQPAIIIRGPRLRTPRNLMSARSGGPRPPNRTATTKDRKQGRPRAKSDAFVNDDDYDEEGVEKALAELAEQSRPVSIRYDPEPVTLKSLKETWPSLPTDLRAHTAGVAEKLSSLSARFGDGYVSSSEMGKRLFQGKYVRFLDEEEKSLAMTEAMRLSQGLADKLSQRKGDIVQPKEITFSPIGEKDRKTLIESLVQGKYSKAGDQSSNSPTFDRLATNLINNGTYQTAGKDVQFFAKVESLLASNRRI
ncbi:uncharacterized protein BP01DRAFT_364853 [Aspergillus saccharolyticus JOP 1030-1]|uniref:Uncharacterized protein n=1 Tax=Aspergillus saccharolyticus JOP 1030-1 TaxID=1450539 RepID=A0A318ZIT6_9EURO|nr:hypothetical protein BP01DRAFT_364853 [Aspergillus saccharolyticus JOP 1030-1]PYH46697.1 hypothetical protein BP01DRAFT_364853 [Aspergillus saccharolyticus JOP 1030-1]